MAGGRPTVAILVPDFVETNGIGRAAHLLEASLRRVASREAPAVVPLHDARSAAKLAGVPAWDRVGYLRRAVRVTRAVRPSIVISYHVSLSPVGYMCARVVRAKHVVWLHGIESWHRLGALQRCVLRSADDRVAVSEFTAEAVSAAQGIERSRIRVIPHCVMPRDAQVGASRPLVKTVLAVATLHDRYRYKGVDMLIEAWPAVLQAVPSARLVIVGDGNDRRRLERLASAQDSESISFPGRVDDNRLDDLYRSALVFALPSRCELGPSPQGEGLGLVFLEAAAAGLPVIAGRVGGAVEAVSDGVTGFLVDPEDRSEIAAKIAYLLLDDAARVQMGIAGRQMARERFSCERFDKDIVDLLETLDS